MTLTTIKTDLQSICIAFKLGVLQSWESKPHSVKGYHVATFNTDKEQNLQYIFKSNAQA